MHNAVLWLRSEQRAGGGMVAQSIHLGFTGIRVCVNAASQIRDKLIGSHHLCVDQGAVSLQVGHPVVVIPSFDRAGCNELVQGEIFNRDQWLRVSLAR